MKTSSMNTLPHNHPPAGLNERKTILVPWRNPFYGVLLGLALCLAGNAPAQLIPDDHWAWAGSDTSWSDNNNWSLGYIPPSGDLDAPVTNNVWLDAFNGDTVFTIPPGAVETPGVTNAVEAYNTIYGPEWGCTLNIFGTLDYDWMLFPVQNNLAAPRSYVNLYSNAVVNCVGLGGGGAAVGLGDSWWFHDAPYVTMNLYSNAQFNCIGGAGLWLGGHLNIYDNALFYCNGYLNMDFTPHQSDGTRAIVLGGGTLKLPEGWINGIDLSYNGGSGNVTNLILRGILRAYGKGEDTNDLYITDDGNNTIVTPVPLGGTMVRVYFQPLSVANPSVGTIQQATLVGDYPAVSAVLLSSSEPGLSPSSFPQPVYTSSNPQIVSVDSNGVLTALRAGQAVITAKVGALTSTNALTVTVPAAPTLIHEYKFDETSGTNVVDSVPGNSPTWDATLVGGATLGGGQVTLDGSSGYVQLPAGILTGVNEVTIEVWASFGSPINTWANLFAFGNTDSSSGLGENYINLQPHTGGSTTGANFGIGDPGSGAETDAVLGNTLDGMTEVQVVAVYHPMAGNNMLYTNGVFAAAAGGGFNNLFNNLMDPVAFAGPTFSNQTILASTLGADPLNYIGHSLYTADPTLNGSIDEFRIYSGPLTPAQIAADYALGPNQLLGTATNVSLTVSLDSGNAILSWPTSSALLTLVSSTTLGPGASWTAVSGTLSVTGGKYQMTVPVSGSAKFFRLQL
jgi:hypothetical protein